MRFLEVESHLSLVKIIILPILAVPLLFLDDNAVYIIAVIAGSSIGAVISTRQTPHTTIKQTISLFFSAITVGIICGIFVVWYFQMKEIPPILFTNFLCGLLGFPTSIIFFGIYQKRLPKKLEQKFDVIADTVLPDNKNNDASKSKNKQ